MSRAVRQRTRIANPRNRRAPLGTRAVIPKVRTNARPPRPGLRKIQVARRGISTGPDPRATMPNVCQATGPFSKARKKIPPPRPSRIVPRLYPPMTRTGAINSAPCSPRRIISRSTFPISSTNSRCPPTKAAPFAISSPIRNGSEARCAISADASCPPSHSAFPRAICR
jgi:hypothetical protein